MASIVLFEDAETTQLNPITLTRSAAFIPVASYSLHDLCLLAAKSEHQTALLCRDYLVATSKNRATIPDDLGDFCAGQTILWLNASLRPDTKLVEWIISTLHSNEPFLATSGNRIAAALTRFEKTPEFPSGTAGVSPFLLGMNLSLHTLANLKLMDYPFHVVEAQKDLCAESLEFRLRQGGYQQLGGDRKGVWVAQGVDIPSLAAFRTSDGPVILDEGVSALEFSFFRGPVYLGPGTKVIEHAAVKDGVSTGRTCKIGGEVECAIVDSFSNKQHHGFLGHAFVGSWVNMGAGTSNSDLKNTYGLVQVSHQNQRLSTGMQFFGCIIGDYSKTAINTSIFTGKIIGVNSMLYGYVGQNVASFTNYASSFGQITECDLTQALNTQKRMFARRKMEPRPEDSQLLKDVYAMTIDERRISTDPLVL